MAESGGGGAGEGEAPQEEQPSDPSQTVAASDAETRALDLLGSGKPIEARKLAEEALAEDPDAIVGNFVLGVALYEAEGLLAKAMAHLTRSRVSLERTYGEIPAGDGQAWLHKTMLRITQGIAGEMEQFDEQIRLIDRYDALYDPDLSAERAWALLKLRSFDEAREAAAKGGASNDPWERSLSRNALCGIEGELRSRRGQYDACMEALVQTHGPIGAAGAGAGGGEGEGPDGAGESVVSLTVDAVNAADAARTMLRFDEVERLALLATKAPTSSIANPWRLLAGLYRDEGRLVEAIAAAREMLAWRSRLAPGLRDQDHAETDAALASLLLAFGQGDAGYRLISRAIERPDRRGLISSKAENAMGAFALIRWSLSRVRGEIAAERASAGGLAQRAKGAAFLAKSAADRAVDEARIAGILAGDGRLLATLRMYLGGGIDAPPWLVGDLVGILGAGVVGVELERARAAEAAAPDAPEIAAYHDGLEAEVALARGRYSAAAELARGAIQKLPPADMLFRARAAAVGAEALTRAGDAPGAVVLYRRALELDPGVFRRLGRAIPAIVRAEGVGAEIDKAVSLLGGSPRLFEDRNGFLVVISVAGSMLRACLRAPDGASLACAEEAPKLGDVEGDLASRLVVSFHDVAFSARVPLTAADLRSLDGATTTAGKEEREQLEEILRSMAGEPSPSGSH